MLKSLWLRLTYTLPESARLEFIARESKRLREMYFARMITIEECVSRMSVLIDETDHARAKRMGLI